MCFIVIGVPELTVTQKTIAEKGTGTTTSGSVLSDIISSRRKVLSLVGVATPVSVDEDWSVVDTLVTSVSVARGSDCTRLSSRFSTISKERVYSNQAVSTTTKRVIEGSTKVGGAGSGSDNGQASTVTRGISGLKVKGSLIDLKLTAEKTLFEKVVVVKGDTPV